MSQINTEKRVVILGGGLCGLSAAQSLARAGIMVSVLEKEAEVGGLIRPITRERCRVDIGSHRIHPDAFQGELRTWLKDLCGESLRIVPRRGRLRLYNRYINYPPTLFGLLGALGPARVVQCGLSFLRQKLFPTKFIGPGNFESRIVGKVGYRAYRIFYESYARKVWRIDPRNISEDEVKKRVVTANPLAAFRDVISNFLSGGRDRGPVFIYPEEGVGAIARALENDIRKNGGNIYTNVEVNGIEVGKDGRLEKVFFKSGGKKESLPTEILGATISPHALSRLIRVDPPPEIREALARLSWRGMRLLYWQPPSLREKDCETYYFPELKYPFGRISVPSLFSPKMGCPSPQRVICIELPSGEGEESWTLSDRELLSRILPALQESGVISDAGGDKSDGALFSHREKNIYPLLITDWRKYFSTVYGWLRSFPNLYLLGRQALFLHNNMDQSITMGRVWARYIIEKRTTGRSWDQRIWEWSDWKIRD